MRISRIYLPYRPDDIQSSMTIEGDKAHYLRNVLRIKPNHTLHFFIPTGVEYQATIAQVLKRQIKLSDIKPLAKQPKPSALKTTLVQGISSSDRMDYTIQKAAELGCHTLIPVLTDFCSQKIPTHKFDKKLNHWQTVAISACEQSGRSELMQISQIRKVADVVESTNQGIFLEPGAGYFLGDLPNKFQKEQVIFIGPEGGFSPSEIDLFENKRFLGIQLGQRILRTETVAPVILSALHTLYGDFRQPAESML